MQLTNEVVYEAIDKLNHKQAIVCFQDIVKELGIELNYQTVKKLTRIINHLATIEVVVWDISDEGYLTYTTDNYLMTH